MICPLEIASDLSALRAARVADHGKHGWLLEGRDGAGDESAGSDFTGDGETDHLVAGGGDRRHQRPLDAAVAGRLPGVWLRKRSVGLRIRSREGDSEDQCPEQTKHEG